MRAVITGGGTGGHIYPALAIADELKNKGWEIIYLGSKERMEAQIVPEHGYKFKGLTVKPLPRKFNLKLFSSLFYNFYAFLQALFIIHNFKADIVIGTGGFAAGPVVLAGALLKRRTVIHEQNAYPGITNKLLARFVDLILLNFAEAEKYLPIKSADKIYVTGNPVRREIVEAEPDRAYAELDLDKNLDTILITGGSQGAEIINSNLIDLYKYAVESKDIQIVHLTGRKNYNSVIKRLEKENIDSSSPYIKIIDYLNEMEYALHTADLIISRAGATALSEIAVCGIPSILVPFAESAEDHQLYNAESLASQGAAVIIEESELSSQKLYKEVKNLISDKEKLEQMSAAAENKAELKSLDKIIELIESEIKS